MEKKLYLKIEDRNGYKKKFFINEIDVKKIDSGNVQGIWSSDRLEGTWMDRISKNFIQWEFETLFYAGISVFRRFVTSKSESLGCINSGWDYSSGRFL